MIDIEYPRNISEFEIHSILYQKLKILGYDIRGEVVDRKICKHTEGRKGFRQSTFDLVIFNNKKAVCIIEVKNSDNSCINGRQSEKYSMYGIPVIYCLSMKGIDKCIYDVIKIIKS